MINLYRISLLANLIVFLSTTAVFGQLSAPRVEDVYGGRINSITGYSKTSDTSRIIISTESANSLFYTDVYTSGATPVVGRFSVIPGADLDANFGGGIQSIAVHSVSGYVYFSWNDGIYKVYPESGSAVKIYSGGMANLLISSSTLVFFDAGKIYWGTLDASGNFTQNASSPLTLTMPPTPFTLVLHPVSGMLYLFSAGNTPSLYKSSVALSSFNSSTTFSAISLSSFSSSLYWSGCGISPSGRIFIVGHDNTSKYLNYTDDEATWTNVASGVNGVSGNNISFGGTSSAYYVYTSSMYSDNNGIAGSWKNLGTPGGMETHPNDGATFVDPNNIQLVYMTTDQGMGASNDRGSTIYEIDDGIEAVQVDDFDMTSDKNTAWLASKSGVRRVTNYLTSPTWTNAMFPNGDGSPYYSSEMKPGDINTCYVGNVRVYKTNDAGVNWQQIFSAENAPYNFPSVGSRVEAIEVADFDTSLIMAGYYVQDSQKGGLFVSTNSGSSWNQILLHASSTGQDVDVYDIVFNLEGSDTIAYVSVEYDLSAPTGRSIYKLTKTGSSWSVSQDMNAGGTSTGSIIVATIRDIHVSSTGDTIFACGTDAGINHPIAYYKPLNTTAKWTPFTTAGFPFSIGKQGYAITLGIDTVYCAVDNDVYFLPLSGSSWTLGYSYPNGTRINFLYYDDLLVGTGTGLYGHVGQSTTGINGEYVSLPTSVSLSQNYPNPFNPSTKIEFSLPDKSYVTLKVYDILGNLVANVSEGIFEAGIHNINFDGKNLPSGVYIYTLTTGNGTISRKLNLLK